MDGDCRLREQGSHKSLKFWPASQRKIEKVETAPFRVFRNMQSQQHVKAAGLVGTVKKGGEGGRYHIKGMIVCLTLAQLKLNLPS